MEVTGLLTRMAYQLMTTPAPSRLMITNEDEAEEDQAPDELPEA
jgi:hypothetical protein